MRIAIDILLGIGVLFTLIGVLGVNRMPDVFGRLQASTCIATMGNISVALAGILYTVSNGGERHRLCEAGAVAAAGHGHQPHLQPRSLQGGVQDGRQAREGTGH